MLLRDEHKAKLIAEKFKHVNVVIGDLDNDSLLEQEASKASIVLRMFIYPISRDVMSNADFFPHRSRFCRSLEECSVDTPRTEKATRLRAR